MARIPLARPYWDAECEQAAIDALNSGRWVKGPQGKLFGEEFAEWCGAYSAVPCQSGFAALWVAMRLLEIGPGDEVIVPGMSFIASATCVSLTGATPIFADIEDDYWCVCPDDLESKITPKTKAIIAVNLFGHPAHLRKLREIADRNKIYLIEDNAQSPLAKEFGQCSGTIGHIGVLSFNYHKHIHTGEGGIIVTNDDVLAQRMQLIRNHAEAVVGGKQISDITNMIGYNFRLGEIESAI